MYGLLLSALGALLQAGPPDSILPGTYCAYDWASLVSPPGDVRTVVGVETVDGKTNVAFQVTWPHSARVLTGEGEAQVTPDGLAFDFTDGWGNRVRGELTAEGELSFDMLEPPPDDWAAQIRIYMYGGATVSADACRPGDEDVAPWVRGAGQGVPASELPMK